MRQIVLDNVSIIIPFGAAIVFLLLGISLFSLNRFSGKKPQSYGILIIGVGVFIALSLVFYPFTIDDTYISLRYARNLADGHGLVYSTDGSEPIEGYTNFLWVITETPLFLLNLSDSNVLHAIKILGMAFGVGIIIVTYLLIRLVTMSERVGLLGALLVSAIPHLSFWAIGGLETPMYIFWLLIGLYTYLVEQKSGKAHIWSIIFFTLLALTRPEGLFFVLAVLLWQLATHVLTGNAREMSKTLLGLVLFTVLYGVYFTWRYTFYGYLLPNTFYARSGSFGIGQLLRRLSEMLPFITYLFPMASFACLGYLNVHQKRTNTQINMVTIALLLLAAFSFASKREWMPGFRYELPFVPLLMLFASMGITYVLDIVGQSSASHWKIYLTKAGVLMFLGLFLLYPAGELQEWRRYTDRLNRAHVTFGKWLKQNAPRDASVAGWDMGAIPYYSELPRIIEIHPEGILSTYITHNPYDVNYLLSLTPSFIILPPQSHSDIGMDKFYSHEQFKQDYQLIFAFAMKRDYILNVYKHRDVYMPQNALDEGKQLGERSFQALEQES